jgi:hypothetical protein
MRTTHFCPAAPIRETAGRHTVINPIRRDERSPLELYEAENAVQIAEAAGADKYAGRHYDYRQDALKNAQDLDFSKDNRKETITFAREAVQSAEDARIITIRKIKAEDEAAQLKAKQDAEQSAQQSQADAQKAQLEAQQLHNAPRPKQPRRS